MKCPNTVIPKFTILEIARPLKFTLAMFHSQAIMVSVSHCAGIVSIPDWITLEHDLLKHLKGKGILICRVKRETKSVILVYFAKYVRWILGNSRACLFGGFVGGIADNIL